MQDQRLKKIADILVNHSTKIKKRERVIISSGVEAKPLVLELYKQIIKKGAYPKIKLGFTEMNYIYYKHASTTQLKHFPKITFQELKQCHAMITIGSNNNIKSLSNIDPKKIAIREKILDPFRPVHLSKKWVLFYYPTPALAQEAEMSIEEMEDFIFNACLIDWKKQEKKQRKLKSILDKGNKVRIIGNKTDISFSIKGRQAIMDYGINNMPGGEVFMAPVETTTEGHIYYEFPAIKQEKEVTDVYLEFKKGNVVKFSAAKNEKLLKSMINLDKGARRLGELGIGFNPKIKKFVKSTLFDEKIQGTIHLALGNAYKEGGGKNTSALHWDMIKDLRKKGEVRVDNKVILKNGKFKL